MRAAVVAVFVLVAAHAHATPNQQLAAANAAFRSGKFSDALDKYNSLLYPPPPKLADREEITEAYVNLGVCRVDAGDLEGAKREFEKALGLDPNRQLDPLLVTNKEAIRLFDDTKADLRNRERDAAAKQALAQANAEREALRKGLVVYESHNFYLNFIPPFGQLQNDEPAKAIAFGSAEVVTLATSVTIWAYLADKYGINNQHLMVDRQTAQSIRTMQELEVGAGIAFLAVYAWASYDAYRHYKPLRRVTLDEKVIQEQLDLELQKRKAKPPKTSFHLVPMITPNGGAGIGVGWEQ